MTLEELYTQIEGDYAQAINILRIEKLLDKHIKKLPDNPIFSDLFDAGVNMNASKLFDSAHAIKGVCSNLGLVKLASLASDIAEEFRPGNERKMSDPQVNKKLIEIDSLYKKTVENIRKYEGS